MGFALFLFFLALTYLRPIEAFAPELVVYRPMLVLLLATFAAALIRTMSTRESAATGQHVRLLLGFSLVLAISIAATGWAGGAIYALVDFAPSMLMFFSTVMLVTSPQRLKATCAVIIASMAVLSIAGALAYHTGYMADKLVIWQLAGDDEGATETEPDVIPANDTSGERLWRVRSLGFLSDPNDFGQALVVALAMLPLFRRPRAAMRNLFVIGVPASLLLYAIYLTHSRGALLGLGSLMFFTIQRMLGTMRTGIMMAVMALGAMALNFTGGRGYSANEESAGGRVDAWSEGLQMLMYRPIFGVGYHRFTEHHNYTAHNSFVLCFAETGLVGYFLWLGLILLVFKQLTRAIALSEPGSEGQRWAAALRTAMLGFFTCAFFLSRAYEPGLFILLGIAVSAAYCARVSVPADRLAQLDAPITWRKPAFIAMVLSIVVIYFIVTIKNATVGRSI